MTPSKSLPRMALPLVVSFTLRFMFSLVDLPFAAIIGGGDNSPVAAIGLFAPIQLGFIAIWVGLSGGFTASLSQAFGSRDEARVAELKRTMLRILVWLVPILVTLGGVLWLFVPSLPLEPGLIRAFRIYATTLVVGMPLTGFWAIYPDSIVKAHQDTRSTMIAGLMSSVSNIALNTLFALVFGWGIFGIALATVLSRIPAVTYAWHRARCLEAGRHANEWAATTIEWRPPLASIFRLAVPGALTFVLGAFENGLVNAVLKDLPDSTTAIATYGVYDRLLQFGLMPAAATAIAVVPFVTRLLPAGDVERIRADTRRALLLVAALALTITVLAGWVFARPLTEFLIKSHGDGAPVALGALRLLPLGALALAPFLVLRPTFEAANMPRLGIVVSLVRYVALSMPLVLLAPVVAGWFALDVLTAIVCGLALAGLIASFITGRMAGRTLAANAGRSSHVS